MRRFTAFALALFLALAGLPAAAEDSSGDRALIRGVISDQIAAFQADDGTTAYSFAAPNIQALFPTVESFMAMVRGGYQPVYHPRSVTFGETLADAGALLQKVYLVGPDGESYVALYSLRQQADGTWKISGCTILKDTSPST